MIIDRELLIAIVTNVRDEYVSEAREARSDYDPYDINCGECECFAGLVIDHCEMVFGREATQEAHAPILAIWLDELPDYNPEIEDYAHRVVYCDGWVYDAECVEGVQDWRQLPCVQHAGRLTREQVIAARGPWQPAADYFET